MVSDSKKKHVVYLAYYGYENTVIDSQVVTPLSQLQRDGFDFSIVFFESVIVFLKTPIELLQKRRFLLKQGIRPIFLPRIPRNFLYLDSLILLLVLGVRFFCLSNVVIHARGLQGAHCAGVLKKIFKKIKLICDVRGLEVEEHRYAVGSDGVQSMTWYERKWNQELSAIEMEALGFADVIFCVSKAMVEYFRFKYPMYKNKKWEYVPCATDLSVFSFSDDDRSSVRESLRVGGRLVVAYVGGVQRWQLTHFFPDLFKALKESVPSAFFLGITPHIEEMKNLFESNGVDQNDFLFVKVKHREIPRLLCAADMGLLVREENDVNAYSCPTKFAEYLACGLYILTTSAIKDVVEVVEQKKIGAILDLSNLSLLKEQLKRTVVKTQEAKLRIAASVEAAKERYDWKIYLPLIKKWYFDLQHN